MAGPLKNIVKISSATVGSRALGFARDAATMAFLGLSAVNAAYTFAFTLPNLFRRLLGEGALSSAMIPIFAQTLEKSGEKAAFDFLNKVLTRAAILLAVLTLAGMAAAFAASRADMQTQRFLLGAGYSAVLMPYMFLICLAAVFGSALNVLGSFGVPSVGPILLNISIICGIFLGGRAFPSDGIALGYCMCAAWLVGGALQMLIPAAWTYRKGWRFKFDLGKSPELGELYALFLPALAGAAIIQVNIFVSKMLAMLLNDAAIPALYIASRLLEFPLGVFTIAVATVFFPRLSALKASENAAEHKREYAKGFLMTLAVAVPATFGLIAFAPDILAVLFQWGVFNVGAVGHRRMGAEHRPVARAHAPVRGGGAGGGKRRSRGVAGAYALVGAQEKVRRARNLQRGAQNLRGELRYDRRRRRRAVRSRRIFGGQGSRALFMRRYNSRRCRRLLRVSHAV